MKTAKFSKNNSKIGILNRHDIFGHDSMGMKIKYHQQSFVIQEAIHLSKKMKRKLLDYKSLQ